MKCPQCELVEMYVQNVDTENNKVEYMCKRCGTTIVEDLPEE